MARFIEAIDVPVPVTKAFHYLADFANTREWDPGVVETERLDPGPLGVGSRFRVAVSFLGRKVELVYAITAYEPPHRVVLVGENETLESIDEITFAPREDGTRVTYEARLQLRGLLALADPLLDVAFQPIGRAAARGLARTLGRAHRQGAVDDAAA